MNDIEQQLSELFERAASQLEPPIEEILEASKALGRRRLRRRNIAMSATTVAVVALTVGAVLGAIRLAPDGQADLTTAGNPPTKVDASPSTTPSARPSITPGTTPSTVPSRAAGNAVSTAPLSGKALLQQMLTTYGGHAIGDAPGKFGTADVIDDDGHGDAQVSVTVTKLIPVALSDHDYTCTNFTAAAALDSVKRPAGTLPPSCTRTTTAAGRPEYLTVTSNDSSGFYDYEVSLFVTDDLVVCLEAGNGIPLGTTVDVTRTDPPLTLAQMQAMVADPAWPGFATTGP